MDLVGPIQNASGGLGQEDWLHLTDLQKDSFLSKYLLIRFQLDFGVASHVWCENSLTFP